MSSSGESTDVVEIDAIGVDEWEHEQHTPRAMDENLAALVKQSSAQSGPARAPTLDDGWEADALAAESAEPAKQRTTTNTVARPAPPKTKTKTMAMPTVAAAAPKPAAPKANAVPQSISRVETKAIVSPAARTIVATTHTGDEPPPGFVEVKPLAARGGAKPPSVARAAKAPPTMTVDAKPAMNATPSSERTPTAKPAAKSTPQPMAAEPKPVAKPAAKPTPPALAAVDPKPTTKPTPPAHAAVDPKPTAKPTPPPMAAVDPKPTAKPTPPPMAAVDPKPTAKPTPPALAAVDPKPTTKPTPPPMAAIDPKPATPPQPIAVVTAEPKLPRAPTPLPFSPMTLPAWPPAPTSAGREFEDWDNPQSAATSVGNRVSPSRPVSADFKPEDSVIVDLNATPTADKPRRAQTSPVIQTSAQNPSTSGVFVMPTAAQPNATPVAAEPPELPPPPIALIGASSRPDADRASSPGWTTPLPQRLPGEPIAAPAAPSWPSAAGLVYEPSAPLAHEPAAPLAAKRAVLLPLVRSRGFVIGVAAAAVLAIVFAIGSQGSRDSKQATIVAASKTQPAVSAASTSKHDVTPTRAGAMPAPTPIAAVEAVAPPPKAPAKTPVAMRRISRSKKPVVVDYDKKPSSSPLDADEALAQARAAYSIGNQHLFAGEGREAVTAYRKALSIYPSYAAGYRGLGLAFAQLDDKPSAIAAFKTYVKLAPSAKDVALIEKRIRNLSVR